MNLDVKVVSFIFVLLLSFFYCLLYLLRDLYYTTENFQIKKFINRLLPFFTKYNVLFLICAFIVSFIFTFYNRILYNYLGLLIIFINLLLIYISRKQIISSTYLRLLSYILIISLILALP